MSTEFRSSTPGSKSRRKLVIAAVLAAVALLATGGVAYWSGDSWSDEAMASSGFPGLPGGDWAGTTSDDGWGPAESSDETSATGTPSAGQQTSTRPATAVVDPASAPTSSVPTVTAPAPSASRATTPPAPSSTAAPSPTVTSTPGNPKPKPTKKPHPSSTPSPTSTSGGCVLLVICH